MKLSWRLQMLRANNQHIDDAKETSMKIFISVLIKKQKKIHEEAIVV